MKKKKFYGFVFALTVLLLATLLFSVLAGRFSISLSELMGIFKARFAGEAHEASMAETVLFGSRLPRIASAALIGCGLSVSGAAYQGIFRNPMASPDLLGASAGAGFGAALGLLLGFSLMAVQLMAFGTGVCAVLLTCTLGRLVRGQLDNNRVVLILCGMVVGSLFQACISLVKYVADPFDSMPSIAFWLMGGLTYVTASDMLFLLAPISVGTAVLLLFRWRLNLLSFGEDEAKALGAQVGRIQAVVIFCATFMTAACVAVGGMVGWVGLIVPHFPGCWWGRTTGG